MHWTILEGLSKDDREFWSAYIAATLNMQDRRMYHRDRVKDQIGCFVRTAGLNYHDPFLQGMIAARLDAFGL